MESQLLSIGVSDAWFWRELAIDASQQEQMVLLERAVHSDFATPLQYIELVDFYEENGEFMMALRYGLEGMGRFPNQSKLGYRMLHFASTEEGRTVLEQKVRDVPEHSKAQALLGLLLVSEKEYDRATSHLSEAIRFGEKRVAMYEILHETWLAAGKEEQAWQTLQQAVEEHPENEHLWERFYLASTSVEQKKTFLRHLNLAWKDEDFHSVKMLRRAFVFARAIQDNEMALLLAEREINLAGSSWRALSRKAQALADTDRVDEAIHFYEKALDIEPDNSFVLNNLAWLLISREDGDPAEPQRALILIQKAIDNSPKPVAGYYDTLAAVFWSLGLPKEASIAQNKAVELDPLEEKYRIRQQQYERAKSK